MVLGKASTFHIFMCTPEYVIIKGFKFYKLRMLQEIVCIYYWSVLQYTCDKGYSGKSSHFPVTLRESPTLNIWFNTSFREDSIRVTNASATVNTNNIWVIDVFVTLKAT